MKGITSENLSTVFNSIVEDFENNKLKEKEHGQYSGIVYTPIYIADFIVNNLFKIYLNDLCEKYNANSPNLFLEGFDFDIFYSIIKKDPEFKKEWKNKIVHFKILDPACGSGRFLISTGNILLKIFKKLNSNWQEFETKKYIIENILYGVELDRTAQNISKIRLLSWLFSSKNTLISDINYAFKTGVKKNLEKILDDFNIKFNIFSLDFLLDFKLNQKFDFIIGNPPYIENKKILDLNFKRELSNTFKSAYRLFDLSIVFLEKSLKLLKENKGYLSFLMTNKFLAADYGIKIRKIVLNETEIKQIINISKLPIFAHAASYPIIISLKKGTPHKKNKFIIQSYKNIDDLVEFNNINSKVIPQSILEALPSKVFPISGNIEVIRYLFSNFKTMSEQIKDLNIIYRPFGFTQWKKFFDNISESKSSENDLLLIGTGNVGNFHIKFDKRIRIAKKDIKISYFKYTQILEDIWRNMNVEKLIFREIAQNLTTVYDPGIFTNITGLYFIRIPSYSTNDLFCLLSILNSKFMDLTFKSLFGTLHMSGGHMRFNGSFIKRLPMPNIFPESLAYLGKINQILSQLLYDQTDLHIKFQEIEKYNTFFIKLADSLVSLLYLKNFFKSSKYSTLSKLLTQHREFIPNVEFKYSQPRYNISGFRIYAPFELEQELFSIKNCYKVLNNNPQMIKEIQQISSSNFHH